MRTAAALIVSVLWALAAAPAPTIATDDGPSFHLELIATKQGKPTYVTSAPSDPLHLYVVGQGGRIRVMSRTATGQPWKAAGTFLDISDRVMGPFVGRGLFSMAFDPRFASNGKFYVAYTRKPDGAEVVVEYRDATALRAKPRLRHRVLAIAYAKQFHFGGWIGFGPDGYMYMTTGDGAITSPANPLDINSRLGKVLRFNAHAREGKAKFVPADNPYVGRDGDDLVWASGLRNPWRASFDSATGQLWLPDVGETRVEEINRFTSATAARAANLGWPVCEGSLAYPEGTAGPEPCPLPISTVPLIEYPHNDGNCSVIGGYVYRGSAQPALIGRYFYADYCTGNIWSIPADYASGPIDPPLTTGLFINSFGVDGSGELYVAAHNGSIWHVVEGAAD
jgi:glucose/arabinose dehydrogenase